MRRSILLLPLMLTLAACGGDAPADGREDRDPAVSAALDDPLMADPDLAAQNRGNSALSGGGPATAEVPPDQRSPEAAARGREAAAQLLGGRIDPAPGPSATLPESPLKGALTLEAIAAALKLGGADCPAKVGYGFAWAARLPAALPVYPRGHTRVAAGSDEGACRLRIVKFVTAVPAGEVIDFYFAAARKAGLNPEVRREGEDLVVIGGKGAARFAVYARAAGEGLSEVDLATAGL